MALIQTGNIDKFKTIQKDPKVLYIVKEKDGTYSLYQGGNLIQRNTNADVILNALGTGQTPKLKFIRGIEKNDPYTDWEIYAAGGDLIFNKLTGNATTEMFRIKEDGKVLSQGVELAKITNSSGNSNVQIKRVKLGEKYLTKGDNFANVYNSSYSTKLDHLIAAYLIIRDPTGTFKKTYLPISHTNGQEEHTIVLRKGTTNYSTYFVLITEPFYANKAHDWKIFLKRAGEIYNEAENSISSIYVDVEVVYLEK